MPIAIDRAARFAEPAERLWALLSDFGHRALIFTEDVRVEGSGLGAIRTFVLGQGRGEMVERIVAYDEAAMSFSYKIIDLGPLPYGMYEGTIDVVRAGAGSVVLYRSRFVPLDGEDADACRARLERSFDHMVALLHKALEDGADVKAP